MQSVNSAVWLAPVPYYAAAGPVNFTINLWFKSTDSSGGLFQYLLSQMAPADILNDADNDADWGPNQASCYSPTVHSNLPPGLTLCYVSKSLVLSSCSQPQQRGLTTVLGLAATVQDWWRLQSCLTGSSRAA